MVCQAGSFSLYMEDNGSAVGNFAAGIAAEAADASTGWYNPAGLALLNKQQFLLSGVWVFPTMKMSGYSLYETPIPFGDPAQYIESFDNLQDRESAVVPSIHYSYPLHPGVVAGLSIVAPFGLSSNWPKSSAVRYAGTFTSLRTLNISPELGAELTSHFAIGAGLDFQYANVTFDSIVGSPAFLNELELPPNGLDTTTHNKGDSLGIGFHAGVLSYFHDKHTRVGINYQSRIAHQFYGSSTLSGRLATPALDIALDPLGGDPNAVFEMDSLRTNSVSLPDIVTTSFYQDLNDRWAVLGSVVYTNWSLFNTLKLYNVAAPIVTPELESSPGSITQVVQEGYRDAWRLALGANYRINSKWMLRCGGGYDETPTTNAERDVRLPDADRIALSIGAHYQWLPKIGIDAGYTHLFVHNSQIDKSQPLEDNINVIHASTEGVVNLWGAQVLWDIE